MKLEDLIKTAEEKYQCSYDKDFKLIKIKFDYFTILIEETEKEISVKVKRGSTGAEGLYSFKVLQEMFKNDKRKILDFIIFRTIEYFYTQKCKSLI